MIRRRTPPPLDFGDRTYVMGVLNVTPDSFSDGGSFLKKDDAVRHGLEMARLGADIIDVGGESTRPGAVDVSVEEETERVIPVIAELSKASTTFISVDTRKARVAEEAVKAGASIINDISALCSDPEMARVAADTGVRLILMHMKGTPRDMQLKPVYEDVVAEIIESLRGSIGSAKRAGVNEDNIMIDPGIGFGKTVDHNLEILNRLDEFKVLGRPICVGTSRKAFIGKVLDIDSPGNRLTGTIATSVIAIMKGADIIRVHDVKEAREASRITDSVVRERRVFYGQR